MQKNRIELAGYLVTKPEARFLPSGTKVANARLKESYRFTGSDGKQQTHANWHSLVFYGEVANIALSYEKDDNIYVEGSLQQRKFTPADGVARTVYEVHARSCHQIASFGLGREEQAGAQRSRTKGRITMIHRGLLALLSTAVTLAGIYATFWLGGVRVNASTSLPIGLYRTTSDTTAKLVEFCPAEPFGSLSAFRGYRGKGNCPDGAEPLMKPIAAVAGDTVGMSPGGVAVNGRLLPNSAAPPFDTKQLPLVHWPFGEYRVAPGTVWVISSFNTRSFDSRYFGPIHLSSFRFRLRPLITEY